MSLMLELGLVSLGLSSLLVRGPIGVGALMIFSRFSFAGDYFKKVKMKIVKSLLTNCI